MYFVGGIHNNLIIQGVESQKKLYGSAGDKVIDVFITEKKNDKNPEEIIKEMELEIMRLGPQNVSKHCADYTKLVVIDIAPSSVSNKFEFINIVNSYKERGLISNFITPPKDPSYHLEIPNKEIIFT